MRSLRVLMTVLLLALCPLSAKADEPITIVHATDIHYISPQLTDNGAYFERIVTEGDGKVSLYAEELTQAFIEQLLAQKPDAVILSGDLTFNGAMLSHVDLAAKLARLEAAGITVLALPGNHDLYNFDAARYVGNGFQRLEGITAEDFADIYAAFGFDEAISRDSVSLSYMAELSPGLRVLMLDVNTERYGGSVRDATLAWAAEQLQKAKDDGAQVIAVSHQNVLQHNPNFYGGYVIMNNKQLLTAYEAAGVPLNLSGHIHVQHTETNETGFSEITTSSLSVSPNQYGVLTVTDGALHYRTQRVDVESWATENGLSDPNLLDFANYADRFFKQRTLTRSAAIFGTEEQGQKLAAFYAGVNAAYFAGRMDEVVWDEALYAQMLANPDFSSSYLTTMREEVGVNHTELTIPLL